MTRTHRLHRATIAVALTVLATACSGNTDGSTAATAGPAATAGSVAATTAPPDATNPSEGSETTTAAAATDPGAAVGDICATIPPLEVINAQLDEPAVRVEELERGPGTQICEAASDGVANVQFSLVDDSSREAVEQVAGQLGYDVTDVNDPALPGAITYSGAVSVFVGTTEYTVEAITFDTISDPAAPAAVQRSAALLAAWLQLLGVSG